MNIAWEPHRTVPETFDSGVEKPGPGASLYLGKPPLYPQASHTASHHRYFHGFTKCHVAPPRHSPNQCRSIPPLKSTAVHRRGHHPLQLQRLQPDCEIRKHLSVSTLFLFFQYSLMQEVTSFTLVFLDKPDAEAASSTPASRGYIKLFR